MTTQYFAHVENGEILALNIPRPSAWQNWSFPADASDEDYAKAGLYPVVDSGVPEYDPAKARVEGPTYEVKGKTVTMKYKVVKFKKDELQRRLDDVKSEIKQKVKQERKRLAEAGVKVGDYLFQTDLESKYQYLALKDSARDQINVEGAKATDPILDPISGEEIVWKTFDNKDASLTIAMVVDIVKAVKNHDFALNKVEGEHLKAIAESTDPAKYDISTKWVDTTATQ